MTERYFFSADVSRVDRSRVHQWLSEQSYWAQGRSREMQDAAIDASRNYGVYDSGTGEQVAYGRVVTDGITFAWFCDVFVCTEARGLGIGKMLTAGVVEDLEPLGLKRVLLSTGDAHGLYAQYGFAPLAEPSKMMARVQ
ncbi:GNAT family N-acetyltransferase [Cryobacterium sp. CG_9.6]|uniref:GNAT family N-acetyltransferase n=1 Tax=Cryobacterium sp. CG_9.6 TaxID=2760710 RepID=UPI0024766E86|nr:GNAT family N-acetyltransferase [Cryobacterium sp. CG_9.6]MDH6237110.1 GNAT superfamily N-acetyltransferase [Cryobacterium sp. CG_9.6]